MFCTTRTLALWVPCTKPPVLHHPTNTHTYTHTRARGRAGWAHRRDKGSALVELGKGVEWLSIASRGSEHILRKCDGRVVQLGHFIVCTVQCEVEQCKGLALCMQNESVSWKRSVMQVQVRQGQLRRRYFKCCFKLRGHSTQKTHTSCAVASQLRLIGSMQCPIDSYCYQPICGPCLGVLRL
jgi:hypothetical protein